MSYSTTAIAHPNVALIKYWGKSNLTENIPSTPSISITLSKLETKTTIVEDDFDTIWINQKKINDEKILRFLSQIREKTGIATIKIETENNFPTGSGLASSASGFAALATALNQHFSLGFTQNELSTIARKGSASSARSIFGGIVSLQGPSWEARSIKQDGEWPLRIIIAKTSSERKEISSSKGMKLTRETSPFYEPWVKEAQKDFDDCLSAIKNQDFEKLADLSEKSCLKMIGTMLSTSPSLIYWNPTTLACVHTIKKMRTAGKAVFFTTDAGPQIKAICTSESAEEVTKSLSNIVGPTNIIDCEIGGDARIV